MSIAVLSSIPSWRVLDGLGEEDFAVGDFDAVVEVLGLGEGEVGLGVGVEEVGTGVGEEIDGVGAGETLVLEDLHRKLETSLWCLILALRIWSLGIRTLGSVPAAVGLGAWGSWCRSEVRHRIILFYYYRWRT